MAVELIDGALYAEMIRRGAANLRNNTQTVNELNVFPIPDGDTGENMACTIEGGVSSASSSDISVVAEQTARGMLMSARGNSGVILSQFFDGISHGLEGKQVASLEDFKAALVSGVKQAYSSVVSPTEGTILTVMREATAAADKVKNDFIAYFDAFIDEVYASVERTPELLPVLKESGVVDSGGAGFAYISEGMRRALTGEKDDGFAAAHETAATDGAIDFDENSEMKFGYCTEVIVQLTTKKTDVSAYDVNTLISYLTEIGGDSIVAFKTGTRLKAHVHTFEPDKVISYCLTVGELIAVKVENMSVQHTEAVVRNRFERQSPKAKERQEYAVVAVADGEGIIEQFRSLGAFVVDGKQTMNPPVGDFLSAFDEVNADVVFVLPNNSNIVMTAKQAAEMYTRSNVIVIDSKTVAEGYSALSMLDYSAGDAQKIADALNAAVREVTTGLVSYAVRDSAVGGMNIKKGDCLGFDGKTLLSCEKTVDAAACSLLDKLGKSDKSVVIAVRGNGVDESVSKKIERHVNKNYPNLEFYEFYGGQDVYSYIFVVE